METSVVKKAYYISVYKPSKRSHCYCDHMEEKKTRIRSDKRG